MFEETLSKNAKKSLALLGESGLFKDAYMAGGTALALQIGHRHSYDFDFFSAKEFDENILVQRIKKLIPEFQLERLERGEMPMMLKDIKWKEVKDFFKKEVLRISKEILS